MESIRCDKTYVTVDWVQNPSNIGISHISPSFNLCGIECRLLVRESLAANVPTKSLSRSPLRSLSPQLLFRKRSSSSPISLLSGVFSSSPSKSVIASTYVTVFLDFTANSSNLHAVKGYHVSFNSATNEISPLFPTYTNIVDSGASSGSRSLSSSSSGGCGLRSSSPCPAPCLLHDGRVFYTSAFIAENCFKSKSSLAGGPSPGIDGSIGFELELSVDEDNKAIDVVVDGWIPDEHYVTRVCRSNSHSSTVFCSGPGRFTPVTVPDEGDTEVPSPLGICEREKTEDCRNAVILTAPVPVIPKRSGQTELVKVKSAYPSSPESMQCVVEEALRLMSGYLCFPKSIVTFSSAGDVDLAPSPTSMANDCLSLSPPAVLSVHSDSSELVSWVHRVNKKQIDVYSAKLSSSCWQLIKAETTIEATQQKIFDLLINDENIPIIDDMIDSVELLVRVDERTAVRRMKAKGVWPTDPRDFIVCTSWQALTDGSVVIVSRSASDDLRPQKKGYVRGFVQVSGYRIEPLTSSVAHSSCRVTLMAHTELGGSLPATVINLLSVSAPLKIMQSVEKYATCPAANSYLEK
jgi:hypothetical protein